MSRSLAPLVVTEEIASTWQIFINLVDFVEEDQEELDLGALGVAAIRSEVPVEVALVINDDGWIGRQLVIDDYVDNEYRSLPDLRRKIAQHIEPIVGKERAFQFGTRHVKRYIVRRQREAASPATINRELNVIRRGYTLAYRSDPPLLSRIPHIAKLAENNVRRGFCEYDQYLALRSELPFHWALFLVIAYNTGVRRSEILGDNRKERLKEPLRWDQVDRDAKRIYVPKTKNGEARLVPFIGDMEAWIEVAWDEHEQNWPKCPYVIHKGGKPVYDPRKAWNKACQAVGLPDLWRHDLRRSAVRNLDRSGVSAKIATTISGHKTRSIYDRYNIVSDRDLEDAAQKMDRYLERKREQAEKTVPSPTQ